MVLPSGEEMVTLAFFVLAQYRRVTDRRTDRQTRCDRYYPRYHSVARVKRSIAISPESEMETFKTTNSVFLT